MLVPAVKVTVEFSGLAPVAPEKLPTKAVQAALHQRMSTSGPAGQLRVAVKVTEPVVTTYREATKARAMSPVSTQLPWQLAVARWDGKAEPPGC